MHAQVLVWTDIADGDVDCETPFLSALLPPTTPFDPRCSAVGDGTAEGSSNLTTERLKH